MTTSRQASTLAGRLATVLAALFLALAGTVVAQEEEGEDEEPRFRLYGFVMTDAGYQSGQSDPDWFDVVRPTKLPSFENEFGSDGNTYFSVRQTRFGVQSWLPTDIGEIWGIFEFELFGTGADAGQTTFRLRHAYLEIGQFGAGQYWSPFMDIDVFPNTVEYWGPSGMVFFRNVQVRWMPIKTDDRRLTVALERPGASGDQGRFEDRTELDDISGHFPLPDLSFEYRHGGGWGYVELAGILRQIEWEDNGTDAFDLSGDATGWGLNLSSNLKFGEDTLRMAVVYGEGIQNYMNDATADIGIEPNPGNERAPIRGVAMPILGTVLFLDHRWNSDWTTSVGFSTIDIDNASGQTASAFKNGRYAILNILNTPAPNLMWGAELQYGYRENFADGWDVDDLRLQFSFRYNFSHDIGGRS